MVYSIGTVDSPRQIIFESQNKPDKNFSISNYSDKPVSGLTRQCDQEIKIESDIAKISSNISKIKYISTSAHFQCISKINIPNN
ncbi:hypothetical protein BpHYR1_023655 [Brachionus plicatilis]|uniref:Uncharacterized protein n=1 Tax=Brachionus plicatilis TaxID=10195 RepID=A0A3M7STY9_BRAPC|nr:hypothetical protein BpHYR1_023655 [Brachionus plicatilis]